MPGEIELTDLKNSLYDEYGDKKTKKQNKYKFQQEKSYIIVDTYGWLRVKNGFGKTVKLLPPTKHNLNTGEYYINELGQILSKSKLENTDLEYLSFLTSNLDSYFSEVKVMQYIDEENIKWIENALLREMSSVLGNEKEKIKVSLYNDIEYLKASELILNNNEYAKFIKPKN